MLAVVHGAKMCRGTRGAKALLGLVAGRLRDRQLPQDGAGP